MVIVSTENNISKEVDIENIIHDFASIRAKGVYGSQSTVEQIPHV